MNVVGNKLNIPILLQPDLLILSGDEDVAGAKLVNAFDQTFGRRCCKKREQALSRLPVQFDIDFRQLQNGFEFRSKDEPAMKVGVVERLNPHSVARQEQLPLPAVPESEGEHAPQSFDGLSWTVLFVEMNDRFRIGIGIELVSALLEVLPEFLVIEDF